MKKHRKLRLLLLFVVVCALISGCSGGMEERKRIVRGETPVYEEGYINIGLIQTGKESDWRDANTRDYQETFTEERGYNLIYVDGNSSPERQVKAMYDLIQQNVDYIVLQPIVETGWEDVLEAAAEAGIPVIVADRQISVDDSLYATWVGSDFEEEGAKAIAWLDNYLKEQNREEEEINIVLLEGTEGATAAIGRTAGILDAVAEHPNWKIVARKVANFTQGDGQTGMEEILESVDSASIDVIISENDNMIFGAMKALEKHNISYGPDGDIIMVSFDTLHEAFEKMIDGKLHLSVECNPLLAGNVEEVILKLERGETLEKKYYTEEGVFSYVDAAQYIDERAY